MIKRDCYYYFEEQHMSTHIPCCALQAFLGGCPCNTDGSYDCTQYISRIDVNKLVEERLKNRKDEVMSDCMPILDNWKENDVE